MIQNGPLPIARLIFVMFLFAYASSLRAQAPATKPATRPAIAPRIAPEEFAKLAADKANVILDVRTPAEFADGHIPGAVNIDFKSKEFSKEIAALDKNKTYLVYCGSGGRSTSACDQLGKLDFSHLYNLDGGITRWKSESRQIEKD